MVGEEAWVETVIDGKLKLVVEAESQKVVGVERE